MTSDARPRIHRLLVGLFRLALLAYPRRLRETWRTEMTDTFRRRSADAVATLAPRALTLFCIREIRAVLGSGVKLRRTERQGPGSGRRPEGPEHTRVGRGGAMKGILTDMRMALRGVKKNPGFTAAATAILALGIGANTTAFGAVKMAILSTPPFPDADRMVMVDLLRKRGEEDPGRPGRWPFPLLFAVQAAPDRLVDPIAGFHARPVTLTGMGAATEVGMEMVSPGYFQVVGRPLALGRGFEEQEGDETGPFRVVVVSYAFWQNRLEGDAAALDRTLTLGGEEFRVIGVGPEGFAGLGGEADIFVPMGTTAVFRPGIRAQTYNHQIWVAGRLRPGATLAAARAQLGTVSESLSDRWPLARYGLSARPIAQVWANPGARTSARLLALAAAVLLLVACANLAGLLLTRARRRIQSGAIRLALGAPRWRLVRLYLLESLTLAFLGGIVGVGLAALGTKAVAQAWPERFLNGPGTGLQVIQPGQLTLDGTVLAFAFVLMLATAAVIGIAPALRASRGDLAQNLGGASRSTSRSARLGRLEARDILLGAQVALALVLLVGAGLVGGSVRRLLGVDEGFRTDHLLTFDFSRPQSLPAIDIMDRSTLPERTSAAAAFDDRLLERLNALPEVEEASVGCRVLGDYCGVVGLLGTDGERWTDQPSVGLISVHEDYFHVLGVPLLRGRGFASTDGAQAPRVVVLSESAAQTYFPEQDPLGHTVATAFSEAEVVGVVGDVLFDSPDSRGYPVVYYSTRQLRLANHALVRTTVRPALALPAVRGAIEGLDPTVSVSRMSTGDDLVSRSVGDRRMVLELLGIFAAVTVLLAAVGVWGVVSYTVADRRRELCLRVALGAEGRDVLGLVTRKTSVTALAGLAVGLATTVASARVLEVFLWETSFRDPATYGAAAVFLMAVVLLAGYVPARRAMASDPVEALRTE